MTDTRLHDAIEAIERDAMPADHHRSTALECMRLVLAAQGADGEIAAAEAGYDSVCEDRDGCEWEAMRAALTASAIFRGREGESALRKALERIIEMTKSYPDAHTAHADIRWIATAALAAPQPRDPAPGGTVTQEMIEAAQAAYMRHTCHFSNEPKVMRAALEAALPLSRPAPTREEIARIIATTEGNLTHPLKCADRILSLMQRGGAR